MAHKFQMDVYTEETGIEMALEWKSAEDLQRAIEFLEEKNTPTTSHAVQDVPFCYLETREQLKQLFDFKKSLEGRA